MTGSGRRPSDEHDSPPSVETHAGELQLIVDGAVQSVAVRGEETPHGYWRALVPSRRPNKVLILGLGGGTVAGLLRRQWPGAEITGVDDDPRVLALAREHFGMGAAGISTVEADAQEYARSCGQQFDAVVIDLFRGERLADFVGQRRFIRRARSLVRPGGALIWNLHRDRRSVALRYRVGTGLLAELRVLSGMNLVLHFRRRRRRDFRSGL